MKKNIIIKKKKGGKEKKKRKKEKSVNGSTVFCLFCVTIDDTSDIYMWGHIDVQADSVKNCRVRLHLFHEIPHRLKKMKKKEKSVNGSTVFCLFYVTIDDTSVIYDICDDT